MEIIKIERKRKNVLSLKLNVAAYVRVSTENELQIGSFESQQKYYLDKINRNENWTLVDIYADEGISGTQTLKRENFLRMIKDAEDGKIDLILTKSVSRFARNTVDTLKFVRMLKEKNIGVYFEEEKLYTLTRSSEMLLTVLSSVAQQEAENTSAHVKLGKEMIMKEGKLTNGRVPYGFTNDTQARKIKINKYQVKVVREAFQYYIECKNVTSTAKHLENKKYKNYYGLIKWDRTSVSKMLRNKLYIGILEMRKRIKDKDGRNVKNNGEEDKYIVYNFINKIVDDDTFYKAQMFLEENKPLNNPIKKKDCVLRCGFCGYSLRTSNKNTKNEILICSRRIDANANCIDSRAIKISLLKDVLIECLIKYMKNRKELDTDIYSSEIRKLNKEKELTVRKKQKNIELYFRRNINDISFKNSNDLIDKKIYELESKIVEIENIKKNNELSFNREREFYNSLIDNLNINLSLYKMLEELNLELIIGGLDENKKKKPFMVRFIILNKRQEVNIKQTIKYYKSLNLNDNDYKYNVLMDYKSKYKKRLFKYYEEGPRILNKSIRVRLELVEEMKK